MGSLEVPNGQVEADLVDVPLGEGLPDVQRGAVE